MNTSFDHGTTVPDGMPSILFPVRVVPHNHCDGDWTKSTSLMESSNAMASPVVRWEEMTPLDWIEKVAAMTEEQELTSNGHLTTTDQQLRIGQIRLSSKSAMVKENTKDMMKAPLSPNSPFITNEEYDPDSTSYAQDRKRAKTLMRKQDANNSWNLSDFVERDPYAAPVIGRIVSLCEELESLPRSDKVIQAFYGIQMYFYDTFHSIMQKYNRDSSTSEGSEERHLLTTLYNKTIQTMEATVAMAKQKEGNAERPATTMSVSNVPFTKQGFSNYMTQWLRENWVNPYPDETTMAKMAETCGTTSSVICNWLINARTRKWKPAIETALELSNRSADCLLDDSIHIFDQTPIVGVDEEQLERAHEERKRKHEQRRVAKK